MNTIGKRKQFDKTLYEVADRDAKAATLKYIKDINYTTVDTTERKDFDIICKATEDIHHLYEVEIKYSWKGEWNPSWKEIRIPYRKHKLINAVADKGVLHFYIIRPDMKAAWRISGDTVAKSEVKEARGGRILQGEQFFHVPYQQAELIELE